MSVSAEFRLNPFDIPTDDLNAIFEEIAPLWPLVYGKNVLISGGTGFIGKWLVAAIIDANLRLNLNVNLFLVTRSLSRVYTKYPKLKDVNFVTLVEDDIRNLQNHSLPLCSFGIHGALDVDKRDSSRNIIDTAYQGTKAFVDAFTSKNSKQSMLLLSSGAVYGKQWAGSGLIHETSNVAPQCNSINSSYGEAKRISEMICTMAADENENLNCSIARCFAFVGPWLPMTKQFAIGNFISDALSERPVRILGDGSPLRSYLYASDLTIMLWKLLFKNNGLGTFNVGSAKAISIEELARLVIKTLASKSEIEVMSSKVIGEPVPLYVPDTETVLNTFSLVPKVTLPNAILKTANWLSIKGIHYNE